jgi:hypothetical protein
MARQNSELHPPDRGVLVLAVTLYAVGLVARVWPFFDGPLMYLQRFPSEDGYFMLTIGRNLALGKGFSTADGTIATNGTQPLTTLLWAACFALVGGSRNAGVLLVLLLEITLSVVAAYALWRLGSLALRGRREGANAALLASAVWFASPLVVSHSMNCLETGAYALTVIWCAHALVSLESLDAGALHLRRAAAFGVLLGVTFWTRNDAVFVISAACVAHTVLGFGEPREQLRARLLRCLVFGGVSVLVAAPWLTYNYVGFGSIVPVSGRAEQLTGEAGTNVLTALTTLFEYAGMVLPIPQLVQNDLRLAGCATLLLLLLLLAVFRAARTARQYERTLLLFAVAFGSLLAGYYGLFFGARWFVQRYLFPLSPFFALLFALILLRMRRVLLDSQQRTLVPLASVAMVALVVGLHVRSAILYREHPHFQVVRWVKQHVPEATWIGAIQTGTLGFYHDRTLNFDGKVNPAAYQALIDHRRPEYVVTTPVQYLADWSGIADWLREKAISDNFELIIRDEGQQLGVLARKPP